MTPIKEAKTTTAFYGATPNYTFQLDDLGYVGLRDQLSACLKSGDSAKSQVLITDEILDEFAIVARWGDLASHWREVDSKILERWGEVVRAVRKAGQAAHAPSIPAVSEAKDLMAS